MKTAAAELVHLDVDDGIETIAEVLDEHGAVIVERMIDGATINQITAEVDAHIAAADPAMKHLNPAIQAFFGDKTRHVSSLAAKSPTFADGLLVHPVLMGLCDRVLLPACANYQLNLAHLIHLGPGAQAQVLHRDEDVWIHVPRPRPELEIASITALVDFEAEIGATRVVPGSHRWPRGRQPEPHEITQAVMPAGSSVIYLGTTIHGAGTNSTSSATARPRPGVHVSYTLGWLRTEENNYLGTPPAVARGLSRRAQEILGYGVHDAIADHGGYLGMVELRDPLDLLSEGRLG